MSNKSFIVPHDFSEVADNALSHAITTAKVVEAKIYLLHVVSKNKDIKNAEEKLKAIVEANKKENVEIIPKVRLGTIFEDIGDFAAEHHAELIFMGTHGASGWQHIAGSYALKVITNSSRAIHLKNIFWNFRKNLLWSIGISEFSDFYGLGVELVESAHCGDENEDEWG